MCLHYIKLIQKLYSAFSKLLCENEKTGNRYKNVTFIDGCYCIR